MTETFIPHLPMNMGIPIGSVTAFAGYIGPPLSESKNPDDPYNVPGSPIPNGFGVTIELQGWMVCDGRALLCYQYPALFLTIGFLYNQPGDAHKPGDPIPDKSDTTAAFRLPDYRGYFLRMVSGVSPWPGGSNPDPDADQRTLTYNAQQKTNGIATIQEDALELHQHGIYVPKQQDTAQPGAQLVDPFVPPAPAPSPNTLTTNPTNDSSDPTQPGTVRTSTETRAKNMYVYYVIKYV